ncbi:MAG: LPS export ABC transporter periplasmic protein LptC [Allorhizobium sp.]
MLNRAVDSAASPGRQQGGNAYTRAVEHSARVRRLKVLLPVAAVVISLVFIGVSVVRAYLPEDVKIESARIENGKVVMEKPAVSGRNSDGISYSMRAERALQDITNPNVITLETIAAAVPINDKVIAKVVALSGIFDRSTDQLDMTEPFTVTLSSGIEASFQSAHLDIKGGSMQTDEPVSITAKEASIVAQSLKMTDKGRVINFAGGVRMHIEAAAIRKTGK